MDIATLLGILLGIGSVFGGFLIEGGHMSAIVQPTAFLIVIGGTFGALMIQYPIKMFFQSLKSAKGIIIYKHYNLEKLMQDIVNYAQKARRDGIVALESDAASIADPFLKKALTLAVDGTDSKILRDILEVDIQHAEEEGECAPKFFEAGGGYAPTVGILGAVLGLIHVMENLSDPAKLGAGIAVAFVATVYGVFTANIIFLPISNKLKIRHLENMVHYEMILLGVIAIIDGENPRIIEQRLAGYCGEKAEKKEA